MRTMSVIAIGVSVSCLAGGTYLLASHLQRGRPSSAAGTAARMDPGRPARRQSGAVDSPGLPRPLAVVPEFATRPTIGETAPPVLLSPSEQQTKIWADLQASGPCHERWTTSALSIPARWQQDAPARLKEHVHFGDFRCFRTGCITTITSDTYDDFSEFAAWFPQSATFMGWPGGKHRTAPDQKGQRVLSTWVFFPPDGA
jgi:hypothetical protein